MRLVINTLSLLKPLSGIGVYTYNLAREFLKLRPDINYIYFRGYFSKRILPPEDLIKVVKKVPPSPLKGILRTLFMNISQTLRSFDLYFEPNFIPLRIRAKRIVTTIHDFSIFHFPEWHPEERVEYFRKNFERSIRISDVLITPSKFVENEARERLGEDLDIRSIPNGYDPGLFFPKDTDTRRPYILFVGTLEPRKNIRNLIHAFNSLPKTVQNDHDLLICGTYGWKSEDLLRFLKSQENPKIRYLGYVNGEKLAELYRGATCLVYPSFYEGFGLPPLEAMACGCPVIVSRSSSLPEVCGDSAYYVDPNDPESIRDGILKLIENPSLRLHLKKKGIERAKDFTWERSARMYLELFESLL